MSCIDQVVTDRYTAIHGDCVESLRDLPDHAVVRLVREVRDGDW